MTMSDLRVPPTACEIATGLLRCPTRARYAVWNVPIYREASLDMRTHQLPLEHVPRTIVLEYRWVGDCWEFLGWH